MAVRAPVAVLRGAGPAAVLGALLGEAIAPRLAAGAIEILCRETLGSERGAVTGRVSTDYPEPRHAHDTYEVCWMAEGRCALWLRGRAVELHAGRAYVVQPGEAHQLCPTEELDQFRCMWWGVTGRGMFLYLSEFVHRRHVATSAYVSLAEPAQRVLQQVVAELRDGQRYAELLVRGALTEFSARVLRALAEAEELETADAGHAAGLGEARGKDGNAYVQRVLRYIHSHYGPEVTLEHLAAVVELSPRYLTTLFRQQTGRTVMSYMADVRHREALSLLRNTDLEIADVARLVGQDDPYYFSRVFKAREGCSPVQYRRLFRAAGEVVGDPVRRGVL